MGIGFSRIGVLLDQQRFNSIGEGHGRHIPGRFRETPGPELKPQSVFDDQIGS